VPWSRLDARTDGQRQLVERARQPKPRRELETEFVEAAAEVLNEGVSGDNDRGAAQPLQSPHRPQPRFQSTVIALDRIVRVLIGNMPCGRQQLIEHAKVSLSPVGRHLDWRRRVLERLSEEPLGRGGVPLLGHEHVDDLPELIDCPVQVPPSTSDFEGEVGRWRGACWAGPFPASPSRTGRDVG